jgi:hypothetical protein
MVKTRRQGAPGSLKRRKRRVRGNRRVRSNIRAVAEAPQAASTRPRSNSCSASGIHGSAGITEWCNWKQDQVRLLLDRSDSYGKMWHRLLMREVVQPINAWCDLSGFWRTTDELHWHLARSRLCFVKAVVLMKRPEVCPRCFGTNNDVGPYFTLVIPPRPWNSQSKNYEMELHLWRSLMMEWRWGRIM